MAARVLLQRRAVAPLAATMMIAGMTLRPQTLLADAPPSKKSIYDDFELPPIIHPAVTLSETPAAAAAPQHEAAPNASNLGTPTPSRPSRRPTPTDRLAKQIGHARLFLYGQACRAEDAVNGAMDRTFALEQSFTSTVASLAPPRESGERVMPGAVYVLVAAMAGSIVARNRTFVARAVLPAAFGLGASWVVLPHTMRNVSDLAWRYEQRVPALANAHLRTRESLAKGWSFATAHRDVGIRMVDEKVSGVRETVEGWVKKGK